MQSTSCLIYLHTSPSPHSMYFTSHCQGAKAGVGASQRADGDGDRSLHLMGYHFWTELYHLGPVAEVSIFKRVGSARIIIAGVYCLALSVVWSCPRKGKSRMPRPRQQNILRRFLTTTVRCAALIEWHHWCRVSIPTYVRNWMCNLPPMLSYAYISVRSSSQRYNRYGRLCKSEACKTQAHRREGKCWKL